MVAVTFATELYRRLTISLLTLVENKSVDTGSKTVILILKQSEKTSQIYLITLFIGLTGYDCAG
jgi:hypothetical protein